jgi:23S rRNA (uracil1939-C5)-methyltransferase
LGRRGRRNKNREPVEVTITHLEPKGAAGVDGDGKAWRVRGAPLGAIVSARPGRKQTARLLEVVQPAVEQSTPVCSVYGLCGGCQLQDTPLDVQRSAKQAMVERLVGHESRAIRGSDGVWVSE